jgi:hypothetical protein
MRIIELPNNVSRFIEYCRDQIGLEIKIKNKNHPDGIYKILSKFIKLFNSEVDKRYVTVLFGDVWVPGNWFDESGRLIRNEMQVIELLIHEMIHEEDRKRLGNVFFSLIYLFPQFLGILGFLSILYPIHQIFSWFLLFFLFLLPLPAPGRAWLEIRGYRANVAIASIFNGINYSKAIAKIIYNKQFKGSAYYWMFPIFKNKVTEELIDLDKLNNNQRLMIQWYKDVFKL